MYGLIFDVDGVLGDTEGPICVATRQMFRDLYGLETEEADYVPYIGTGAVKYVEGPAQKYGCVIDTEHAIHARHENFVKLLETTDIAFPGAVQLIETVAADPEWKLSIATSTPGPTSVITLKAAGVDTSLFNAYIHGDMITHKKPHPEIYLTAANAIGLEPKACVVIEDSVAGVEAAKAAGMQCIAVMHTFTREQLHAADLIVEKIGDINFHTIKSLVGA